MLFRDHNNNLIEINKKDYANDIDYYSYIIKVTNISKDEYNEEVDNMFKNEKSIRNQILYFINH